MPPLTKFLVVVTARTPEPACDNYTLELFGLPCPPPTLAISRELAPDKVRVHWSTSHPGFTAQQASAVNGTFSTVIQAPAIVGGRYVLTNITATANRFYRLFKPAQ